MAFQSFTVRGAEACPVAAASEAAAAVAAAVPRPPSEPRKRPRVTSEGGRRRSRKVTAPAYPVKAADVAWTAAENEALREAVMEYGERKRDWPKVGRAMAVHGRDKDACRTQWLKLRPPVKGSWTEEEDRLLAMVVNRQGPTGWSSIAKHIAGRNAKQCRERWVNHLNPNVNKTQWTEAEDKLLVAAHNELGNKWSEIAKRLPGRPDNAVKNRWYTLKNRANGGRRKRRRTTRRPTPSLASLLAKHAKVDLATVDETTKRTFSSLANRLSEIANEQLRRTGALPAATGAALSTAAAAVATAAAGSSPAAAPAPPTSPSSDDDGILCARPPAKRRPSFRRRSLLHAPAAGVATSPVASATVTETDVGLVVPAVPEEDEEDTLDMSHMSLASDVLRDAAVNLSIDLERSVGLDSASFASDLLTALDASLDDANLSNILAQAAALPHEPASFGAPATACDARVPSPLATMSEPRAPSTPSPPPCPAPPSRPRRNGRRPSRTVTTFSSQLLAPSPSAKPGQLIAAVDMPAEILKHVPLPAMEASPLDALSMNSLSLSLADLSFFQSTDGTDAAATTTV